MAFWPSKGTLFTQDVSSAQVTVAQCISIKVAGMKPQHTQTHTLDQGPAGIPILPTGFVDCGSVQVALFMDPALSGFRALTARVTTPANDTFGITWSNTGPTSWTIPGMLSSLGATAALAEALKSDFEVTLNGLATGI